MRRLTLTTTLLVALCSGALAQAPGAPPPSAGQTAQRDRMKTCNADAGSRKLKGADRKGFMADCLAGKSASPARELTPQQAKMKSCNADASAKSLKGAARTSFMSGCLKG